MILQKCQDFVTQCDEGHWYVVNKQVPCQMSVITDESGEAEVKFSFCTLHRHLED